MVIYGMRRPPFRAPDDTPCRDPHCIVSEGYDKPLSHKPLHPAHCSEVLFGGDTEGRSAPSLRPFLYDMDVFKEMMPSKNNKV